LQKLLKTLLVVGVTLGESGLQTHPLIFLPQSPPLLPASAAATAPCSEPQNSSSPQR